jgi:hypothetical protein
MVADVGGLPSKSLFLFFLPKVLTRPFLTLSLFLSIIDLKDDFSMPETSMAGTCGFLTRA